MAAKQKACKRPAREVLEIIGLDIGKCPVLVVGMDPAGQVMLKEHRGKQTVIEAAAGLQPCSIGREACSGAHFPGGSCEGKAMTSGSCHPSTSRPTASATSLVLHNAAPRDLWPSAQLLGD